jgi:hypothetical protein
MTSIRNYLNKLFTKEDFITVVSGLPRSGTSMMMSALQAGGMPLVVDDIRQADPSNPKGYYEFERVKKLPKGDMAWLATSPGKAVKIISALLEYLPKGYSYRVIFMQRDLNEVMASQQRMMIRNGKEPGQSSAEEELSQSYAEHLAEVTRWLDGREDIQTLIVSYNDVLSDPTEQFQRLASFLDQKVDAAAMTKVVDPQLYREKSN